MITDVLSTIKDIINSVIPILVSFGVVYFVWGVVAYVIAGGEEAKKKGRDRIIYGIIGLAIIVSVWGVVNIIVKTFNLSNVAPAHTTLDSCDTEGGLLSFGGIKPDEEKTQYIARYISCLITDSVIPFLFAVALVVFVWGVVKFFFVNSDEEAKRSQGKQFMIWGIIALVVMMSVWGLVNILASTLGIDFNAGVLPQTKECGRGTDPGGVAGGAGSNCI